MYDKSKSQISMSDLKSILHSAFMTSPEKSEALFNNIDTNGDGLITYGKRNFFSCRNWTVFQMWSVSDEFKSYTMENPEYSTSFMYQELSILNGNLELKRLAAIDSLSPTTSQCGHTNHNFSCLSDEVTHGMGKENLGKL